VPRTERDYITRVDDGILVQAAQLAHLRGMTLRGGLEDFRASAVENAELSKGTDTYDIWRTRLERCDMMLANTDDVSLRRRVREARENDR
jgi:hypothetical protein